MKPVLGRIFFADEMQDKAQTVVISNSFWASHFNRDPEALGKTFNLEGVVSTVVGVMPAGFAPFYGGRIDLWQPINPGEQSLFRAHGSLVDAGRAAEIRRDSRASAG